MVLQTRIFFLVNHFSRTIKKVDLYYKTTFFSGQPLFSNQISRTRFLKPDFYKLQKSRAQNKRSFDFFLEVSQIEYIRTIIVQIGKKWDLETYRKNVGNKRCSYTLQRDLDKFLVIYGLYYGFSIKIGPLKKNLNTTYCIKENMSLASATPKTSAFFLLYCHLIVPLKDCMMDTFFSSYF